MANEKASIAAHLAAARPGVLAALLSRFKDMDIAEDAFQTAALRASTTWLEQDMPRDPSAWLIRAAGNAAIDMLRKAVRRNEVALEAEFELYDSSVETAEDMLDAARFGDELLRLMFLCCHPSLSPSDQMLLCLRFVLGLSVDDLARAFLVSADTLQRRVSRARSRAKELIEPDEDDLTPASRADAIGQVRIALYLMFNKGYGASNDEPHIQPLLMRESLRLARLLLRLYPEETETQGLVALFLGQQARQPARIEQNGKLVSMADQDRSLWNRQSIREASLLVQKALLSARPGPLQVQAAIVAVHNAARKAEDTDWAQIHQFYLVLEAQMPSPVVTLNRLVAYAELQGEAVALEEMKALADPLAHYLPFHSVQAGLCERAGKIELAISATQCALSCNPSAAERTFLNAQLSRLENSAL